MILLKDRMTKHRELVGKIELSCKTSLATSMKLNKHAAGSINTVNK